MKQFADLMILVFVVSSVLSVGLNLTVSQIAAPLTRGRLVALSLVATFKFVQHFMWISYAMDRIGEHHDEMWDEQDGFFYDLLRLPDGQAMRLKVRSLVGLLPLYASTVFEADAVTRYPKLMEMIALFRKRHPELVSQVGGEQTKE